MPLGQAGLRVPDSRWPVTYQRIAFCIVTAAWWSNRSAASKVPASPWGAERRRTDRRHSAGPGFDARVLIEEYVPGDDLRIVVIAGKAVAAAVRTPPAIEGTGEHSVEELIVGPVAGASGHRCRCRIPMDDETRRCVSEAGYTMTDVLPQGITIVVRKTANLHTGGTLHGHRRTAPRVASAAEQAADPRNR